MLLTDKMAATENVPTQEHELTRKEQNVHLSTLEKDKLPTLEVDIIGHGGQKDKQDGNDNLKPAAP